MKVKSLQTGRLITVECKACYDEEGSRACIRPAHKKRKQSAQETKLIDKALRQLRECVSYRESWVPDRLGGYSQPYGVLNGKEARKVLEKLVAELR